MQFVATTHSPIVIQSLRKGVLLDLSEMELDDAVYNLPLHEIIEDVQQVEASNRSARKWKADGHERIETRIQV